MDKLGEVSLSTITLFGKTIEYNPIMFIMTWLVVALIIFLGLRAVSRLSNKPGKLQSIFELIYEFLEDITISTLGKEDGKRYLPFIVTIFVFVLTSNWISLIPNVFQFLGTLIGIVSSFFNSSVTVAFNGLTNITLNAPDSVWYSFLLNMPSIEEPTKFINTDLAIALLVFFAVQGYGIRNKGFLGYLRGFVDDPFPMKGPLILLFPLNPFLYLNIIGAIANTVSHAFRLFGNIFGGGMIIIIVSSLLKFFLVPVGLNGFFTIFAGVVQAFVFTMLSITYIQQQQ